MPQPTPGTTTTKKLLFLVNVDWFFISHRLPIAAAALKAGYEVHIAARMTDRQAELAAQGFTLHPLPISRGKTTVLSEIKALLAIYQTLKQVRPDVLHAITIKPVLYGGLAARFCRVNSMVAAISGLGYVFTTTGKIAGLRRWFVSRIYRLALQHPRLSVICQNRDDLQLLTAAARLNTTQTLIIPGSGVNLARFNACPEPHSTPFTVVMAARLLIDKGVREFAEAANLLRQRHPTVVFQLAGTIDPDNPASITSPQLAHWQQTGAVRFLGQRDDIHTLFAQAHIVVLPSYREGFPKVLIEAAAAGRAVVTTDVPGCRDAIIPDVTGLLVPPREANALADAIHALLTHTEQRQAMGRAGRQLAEARYAIDSVVSTHLAIYQQLLSA